MTLSFHSIPKFSFPIYLDLVLVFRCGTFSAHVRTQTEGSTTGTEHKRNRRFVCGDSGAVPRSGSRSFFPPLRHHCTAHAWYVCMYACMYVRVCTYGCVCVCVYARIDACVYVLTFVSLIAARGFLWTSLLSSDVIQMTRVTALLSIVMIIR